MTHREPHTCKLAWDHSITCIQNPPELRDEDQGVYTIVDYILVLHGIRIAPFESSKSPKPSVARVLVHAWNQDRFRFKIQRN